MTNILCFSRNRCTSVEQMDENNIKSVCRLQDTLTEAFVEIIVKLPDLEIISANCEFTRSVYKNYFNAQKSLQKLLGIRIGAGVLKIIKGLVGEDINCPELIYMTEEVCHAVILSFTKDTLDKAPLTDSKEFYQKMVKDNTRLYNRCAAFAPGSSLVEGLDPP